jgi:ABC-type transport system involved in multi-copper enzyme maturation permease subunit
MSRSWQGTTTIAVMTFQEAVRNKLLLVTLVFAAVLTALSVSAGSVSLGHRGRLIIDVGLAAASMIGSIIAIALTVISFGSEVKNKTAYTLLTRPISRWAYLFGKYLGIVATMEIVVSLMLGATALTVSLYGEEIPVAFWGSAWLTLIEMWLVVGIALFFSTVGVPVLAATYSVGLIIAGNLSQDILNLAQRTLEQGDSVSSAILQTVYWLIPDLSDLSLRPEASNALEIPEGFIIFGTIYGLAYGALALVAAMWVFTGKKHV